MGSPLANVSVERKYSVPSGGEPCISHTFAPLSRAAEPRKGLAEEREEQNSEAEPFPTTWSIPLIFSSLLFVAWTVVLIFSPLFLAILPCLPPPGLLHELDKCPNCAHTKHRLIKTPYES